MPFYVTLKLLEAKLFLLELFPPNPNEFLAPEFPKEGKLGKLGISGKLETPGIDDIGGGFPPYTSIIAIVNPRIVAISIINPE